MHISIPECFSLEEFGFMVNFLSRHSKLQSLLAQFVIYLAWKSQQC